MQCAKRHIRYLVHPTCYTPQPPSPSSDHLTAVCDMMTWSGNLVQEPGMSMCPPPGGGNDIVFFRKVIGCSDYSRRPLFISSKLFGLRVEKENQYISKLAKKNEKYQNDKLYHISHVREVKESNKIVIFAIRGQL